MYECDFDISVPPREQKKSKRFYGGGDEVPAPDCQLIVHGNVPLAKISSDGSGDNQVTDIADHQNIDNNGNPLTPDTAAHGDGDDNNVPVVNDIDTLNMP